MNRAQWIRTLALASLAWLASHVACHAAPSCTVVAQAAAELQLLGSPVSLPASLDDCRGAVVTRGTVVACTAGREAPATCRAFAAGQSIEFGGAGPPAVAGTLDGLRRLLGAASGPTNGRLRGAETLLPSKVVLLLDAVLLVDFSEADMQGVEAVEIRRDGLDGPLAARIDRVPGPASISGSALSAGTYYWAVPVPGGRPDQLPRRFSLAPEPERQAASEQMRVFDRQQAGPLATAMMRAAWLAQRNYDYDALVAMKAVGLRTR